MANILKNFDAKKTGIFAGGVQQQCCVQNPV